MSEGKQIAIGGLHESEVQLAAVQYLRDFAGPEYAEPVVGSVATNLSIEYRDQVARLLVEWEDRFPQDDEVLDRAIAKLHGESGQPVIWRIAPTSSHEQTLNALKQYGNPSTTSNVEVDGVMRRVGTGATATIRLPEEKRSDQTYAWVALSRVLVHEDTPVEILTSTAGQFAVWLNGQQVFERETAAPYKPDSDRIAATLSGGMNVIALLIRNTEPSTRFHLRLRRRSSKQAQERLTRFALRSRGNPQRGREVFENAQKSACVNCHRIGDLGGRVGPDLSGIGRRFSRIHLIESILDPSRSVAPSYATIAVVLNSGRILTGVPISKDDESMVIGDNQGKLHQIALDDVDQVSQQDTSIMPEGLDEKLTEREFADLLAFLESLKAEK